ncbi:MAG: formate dehydrogenase accessory sulfurtransferase FdhD [Myxococcales bacterium]|nr:formate dehydrogenase accessory sulfurtransferase FdhD [Myxococcales bacterium]
MSRDRIARRDVESSSGAVTSDELVVEEPLEIRVAGDTVAVTMRTPGDDPDLVLGFLFAEGVVRSLADVGTITHCGRPGEEGYGNVVDVLPGPGVVLVVDGARRGTLTTASCGVCGRRTIADLMARCRPVTSTARLPRALVHGAAERLAAAQIVFARTGGLHGALLLDESGATLAAAEDVGRHNAVDKVIGAALRAGTLARGALLFVSGRTSFEIVQKAAVAGIPAIAGVSAASTLAVDLAREMGITLAGFVRGERATFYAHPERMAR